MRILILGGDGMLGHQLLQHFQTDHVVRVTLRRDLAVYRDAGLFDSDNAYAGVDVRSTDRLIEVVADFQPEAVINAVGIVKQRKLVNESIPSLEINALFPHRLAMICKRNGARLVHVSTDCVFSGRKGGYTEQDESDAVDLYGRSKFLGEVHDSDCITFRTSIIGLELSRRTGLMLNPEVRFVCVRYGNVLASRGSVIPLFHDQIRNGGPVTVTVPEMTRFLLNLDHAVDTVFAALRHARPGEIYLPDLPASTIIDIATALIGERDIEIKITGARPGEKLHEVIVSEEECRHAVSRDYYYVILPVLPELRKDDSEGLIFLNRELCSADAVIDRAATEELLRRHNLLIETTNLTEGGELLR